MRDRFDEFGPAPDQTHPADKLFFAMNMDRRIRMRTPFRSEIRNAKQRGRLPTLQSGQEFVVIVQRLGGPITTMLAVARLDPPGTYPDTDDDIRRAFGRQPKPVAPAGVAA